MQKFQIIFLILTQKYSHFLNTNTKPTLLIAVKSIQFILKLLPMNSDNYLKIVANSFVLGYFNTSKVEESRQYFKSMYQKFRLIYVKFINKYFHICFKHEIRQV